MKRYILVCLVALAGWISLSSCLDDNVIKREETYESGIPVTLSLSFSPNTPKVATRANGDINDEYGDKVFDLAVFAFDKDGTRVGYNTYSYPEGQKKDGTVTNFQTISGANYIYAVANMVASNYGDLSERLAACKEKTSFLAMTAKLAQESMTLTSGRFLMSGAYGDSDDGKVNVSPTMTNLGTISLRRIVSSVTVKVKFAGKCTSFIPQKMRVMSVPRYTNLFEQTSDVELDSQVKDTYFSGSEDSFAKGQSELTFYMMENRPSAKDSVSIYKDRFAKKPANATYIILKGYYEGKADKYENFTPGTDPSQSNAVANVTYYIPLGYSKSAGGTADLNDYKTERNTRYTYTVTVNGVDDVVVEVINDTSSSTADGDIIYTEADKPIMYLDAHYEARLLKFKKSDISAKGLSSYKVKSPVINGSFYYGPDDKSNGTVSDLDDQWVHFQVNPESSKTSLSLYPGDENVKLLTISGLLGKIQDAINPDATDDLFDENGDLYVTAFVDEYYYDNKHWSAFANKPNREMLILCHTKETDKNSSDNSSLTEAAYVLSQRSIQTFYVTDNANIKYAIGVEWTNETKRFEGSPALSNNSSNDHSYSGGMSPFIYYENLDGRANMISEMKSTNKDSRWDQVPYLSGNLENYNTAYNACMTRNRNTESFNNLIVDNEVKWFLPSIQQYQDVVLGQNGYDSEAILYPSNTKYPLHFYASGGGVLWAEEGMSYSQRDKAEYGQENRHSVRCMRYLGTVERPKDGIDYVKKGTGNYEGRSYDKLVMSYLNPSSLRGTLTEKELIVHSERDGDNRPYKAFLIYPENTVSGANENTTWKGVNKKADGNNKDSSKCPMGWRVPNQRELSLVMMHIVSDSQNAYISRTYSADKKYGFVYSSGSMGLDGTGVKGSLRCVRDVEP